jgi:hypothetical protein
MRAIESDRWLLQVAPTGFSAVIDPDGTVHQRSAVSQQVVLADTVELREGKTPYTRLGMGPAVVVALACLVLGWLATRRSERTDGPYPDDRSQARVGPGDGDETRRDDASGLEDERDRPVVHEGDAHVGPEPAGRHLGAERP